MASSSSSNPLPRFDFSAQGISQAMPATDFVCFTSLPTEIQLKIWRITAFMPRVVDVELINIGHRKVQPNLFCMRSSLGVPPMLHVCHAARMEGLKHYELRFGIDVRAEYGSLPSAGRSIGTIMAPPTIYVNFVSDTICPVGRVSSRSYHHMCWIAQLAGPEVRKGGAYCPRSSLPLRSLTINANALRDIDNNENSISINATPSVMSLWMRPQIKTLKEVIIFCCPVNNFKNLIPSRLEFETLPPNIVASASLREDWNFAPAGSDWYLPIQLLRMLYTSIKDTFKLLKDEHDEQQRAKRAELVSKYTKEGRSGDIPAKFDFEAEFSAPVVKIMGLTKSSVTTYEEIEDDGKLDI